MAKERPKREGIMLAYPVDEGRLSRLGKHFIIQPKINGERAIVEWFAGEPVLISSYGNEFRFLDHIKNAILDLHKTFGPIPLDGEIYVHGWSREQIDSALRRRVNRSSEVAHLCYHIFDIRSVEPTYERMAFLHSIAENGYFPLGSPLLPVLTTVADHEQWMPLASQFIADGYEGAILRGINAPWEAKRTVSMLKFKPTEKDEYEILDVNEAIDKHGNPKGMVGSFLVRAQSSEEPFKVGAGKMSHIRRIELWKERHLLTGKKLVVKHEPTTTNGGVPLCAVAVDLS